LFTPVSRSHASLATSFGLVGCAIGGNIALVFFGVFQLFLGYLIFRSTFLPRILGALIALAGVGWLIFLSPPIPNSLLIYLEVLGFVAEAALMLWLLVRGVNVERWQQIASGSSQDA
jgi:Domain of unknown function (DUF4386)